MTPKEKAKYLVQDFQDKLSGVLQLSLNNVAAKECAIMCVDEIIDALGSVKSWVNNTKKKYFKKVKEEIKLL